MSHPTIVFLEQLLQALQEKKIVMAHLRYKPLTEEVAFEGDYDFITAPGQTDTILQILFDLASVSKIDFVVNRSKYGKLMIYLYSGSDTRPILLEIWSHLDVRRESQTLGYILWEDIRAYVVHDEVKGDLLMPELEGLYYLSHLKSKKKDLSVPLIQTRLEYYKEKMAAVSQEYSGWFAILLDAPHKRDEIASKANAALVKMGVLFTPKDAEKRAEVQKLRLRISMHRIYAQWLKKVKIIPVVGPDGVGKTSIIETLKKRSRSKIKYYRFKNLFRHGLLYQTLALFLRRGEAKKVEKNQYDDLYGDWMVRIASLRYPFLLLVAVLGKRFFFSDRFFQDLIIQDTRFLERKAHLREEWKALLKMSPRTFWFIHLDAPTEVILARKDELNAEAIDCYRRDVFTMYLQKPSLLYSYVNTDQPIEVCAEHLIQAAKAVGIKANVS